MNTNKKKQNGMAAIITVIVIGAVVLIMGKSLASIGLSHTEATQAYSQGNIVRETAVSCVEEVIRRFQIDENYRANNKSISLGAGQCTYTTTANGQERTIQINAEYNDYYSAGVVVINVSSGIISLINWRL